MKRNKDKKRKYVHIVSIACLLGLLIGLTSVFVLLSRNPDQKRIEKPTIALVNEDVSSQFNQKSYSFGNDFVNLVSNDTTYNWQVVSRAVAEKAYKDSSIDAVIYLPQTVSQRHRQSF